VRAEQVLSYLPLVGVATVVLMLAVVGARVARTRGRTRHRPARVTNTDAACADAPDRYPATAWRWVH
ncbi:hypothetical protein, partial [Kocuria sabuli]|uniref:hypothetical protein n=1 Tax=Kocuria sabuli TaxID=3071448 RepID=UPI0034D4394F